MEVKFSWATSGKNPREVCDLTLDLDCVPRLGKYVDLSVQVARDEWVHKSGRVKDVIWQITAKGRKATVILGV
jgi:adenylate cyclase class IV